MNIQKNWRAYQSLVEKEVIRIFRIWVQAFIPSTITLILYFLIFGKIIGDRVGVVGGVSYMEFIAPGLIIMPVITNTYGNVVSSFYSVRWSRAVEEMLVSPMPYSVIIAGYMTGGVIRGLLNGIIIGIVGSFLAHFTIHDIGLSLLTLVLTSMLFSLAGFLNAQLARKMDDLALVPSFILTPLIYFGGVFYNIHQLPTFWEYVSKCNPIAYIIDLFRYATLGIGSSEVWIPIVALCGFIIVFYTICLVLMRKGVGIKA